MDGSFYKFRVNPCDAFTFTYLSTLARMYDRYKFHALRFTFVTGASTSSSGRYYMAHEPDSEDQQPADSAAIMAMQHSFSAPVWQSGSLSVKCPPEERFCSFKIDTLKDNGMLYFLSPNVGGSTVCDLYVEYDVTLADPQLAQPTTQVFGTGPWVSGLLSPLYGPEVTQALSPPTAKSFFLSAGYYYITTILVGTGLVAATPTVSSGAAVVGWTACLTSTTTALSRFKVFSPAQGSTVTFGDTFTTLTAANLVVSSINLAAYNQA